MSEQRSTVPRHVLFATDLGARCDRAQDRVIELARKWRARLTVVHALEILDVFDEDQSFRIDVARDRALAVMRRDFEPLKDLSSELVVQQGRASDVVIETLIERKCDLVVGGLAGSGSLETLFVGSTVSDLVRRARVPVLIVRKKVRGPYGTIVVASDLSPASSVAMDTAAVLFPSAGKTLFHAFDLPFRGFVDDKGGYELRTAQAATADARRFLADRLADKASKVALQIVCGDPAPLLASHVATFDADLVIAGTQGRTGLLGVLIGSVAQAILEQVPCDVMVVPPAGAG